MPTLSKGMPIESVSRVLGHTNIVTTQIYARAPVMAYILVVKPITPLELVRFARKEPFVIASTGHLLHICDEIVKARHQFFDKRSGKPITS